MAAAAVIFHPAAAQEAESAYDCTLSETLGRPRAFATSYGTRLTLSRKIRVPSLAMAPAVVGTFSSISLSLVYVIRGDQVEILVVAHSRRRPGYWRSRL